MCCWFSGLEGALTASGGAKIGLGVSETTAIPAASAVFNFDMDLLPCYAFFFPETSMLLLMSFSSVFLSTLTIVSKSLIDGCAW